MPGQIEQRPILLKLLSLFDPKEGWYLDKNLRLALNMRML